METEQIAKFCHEVNKLWCDTHGDFTQEHWEHAEEWQRESAIKCVGAHQGYKAPTQRETHIIWMNEKKEAGWVYGTIKDTAAKTHPCLVPFDELPEYQQRKDALFGAVVKALSHGV